MTAASGAVPVVFNFLGYHFQAGPLIVGVAGVILARQIIVLQSSGPRRWVFEIVIMLFCAFVTALLVQDMRSLLSAGLAGVGIGSLGVGIIEIVKSRTTARLRAALDALVGAPPVRQPRPVPRDDDGQAIEAAVEALNKEPYQQP